MSSKGNSLENKSIQPKKIKTLATKVTGKSAGTKKVTLKTNTQDTEFTRKSYNTIKTSSEFLENNGSKSTGNSQIESKKYTFLENLENNVLLLNAIDENESSELSPESEDSTELEEEQEEKDICILDKPDTFFRLEIISDEESLTEEESDYINQNNLENEQSVFGMFEDVPQLDELSLALSDDFFVNKPIVVDIQSTVSTDLGKFVNPLTGVKSPSSTLSTISKIDNDYPSTDERKSLKNEKKEQQYQGKSDISNEDVFAKDIGEPADDLVEVNDSVKDTDEIFQQFLQKEKEIEAVVLDEYKAVEIFLVREEQARLIQQHTFEFLNKLIDHCVAKSECIDANIILRKSLDKSKLMSELKTKYDVLEMERRVKQFLNRKCVEYFKRKSCFRVISPDDPKTLKNVSENMFKAFDSLDKWLIREGKIKSLCTTEILEANEQFKEVEQQTNEGIDQLEQLVKTTFHRDNFDKLQTLANNSLSKMAAIRKKISKVRFRLLLKQHQASSLQEQRKSLEDLGNGLRLTQYENMEIETNVLSKKLEERNAALKKLYNQCNSDLHHMAHLKEKGKMLRQIVTAQKQHLQQLMDEMNNFRTFVVQLKVKRQKLRSNIRNISLQSGLLDNPVLMKDYDETVKTANKLRQTIEDLKSLIIDLNTKITALRKI